MSDDEFGFDDDDAWWKAAEKAQDEFGFDDDDWEAAEIAAVAVTAGRNALCRWGGKGEG